ncbi:glycosyltransferase family 4 protein [Candidatus Woesearchaeota archaeon]|nr:glycosyltransferase family 4 protein [Candidatus Woesearchaeota archaeon]
MERRKILMILAYYHPYCSGVTEYARRLAEKLVEEGHSVTVFTSWHDKSLKSRETVNGVQVIRNPVLFRLSKGVVSPFFALRGAMLSRKFDFVNIHLPMFEAGILSLLVKKNKLVTTYHCDLTLNGNPIEKLIEWVYYRLAGICARRSSKIVTYTEDYAASSKVLKNYRSKTDYALPFIDFGHFRPLDKAESKRKFGIDNEAPTIGFIGRFVFEKGIPVILKAMPQILRQYPSCRLMLAGDCKSIAGGSIYPKIRDKISALEDKAILPGLVGYNDLPSFYSALDVLMLPSIDRLEAFGIVQAESMLCGTPVIATDLPGVRMPVKMTGMGIVIKPNDAEALAGAVANVLKNRKSFVMSRDKLKDVFGQQGIISAYNRIFSKSKV